jgi:hypothetical protein
MSTNEKQVPTMEDLMSYSYALVPVMLFAKLLKYLCVVDHVRPSVFIDYIKII